MYSFSTKNFYERLGVDPDASASEIKRAYRQLARKYHPDVATDEPDAKEMFLLINEAHQTLFDPEKRRDYDESLGYDSTRSRNREKSSASQARTSSTRASEKKSKQSSARKTEPRPRKTPQNFRRESLDTHASIEIPLEDAVKGAVHTVTVDSEKLVDYKKHTLTTYQVRIPKGAWRGQRLRIRGCGLKDTLTGETGDLYLSIQYKAHDRFRVLGSNLLTEVEITPWDAVLGSLMHIPSIHGKATLEIPKGVQNGQRFRLNGYGMPDSEGKFGDMLVSLKIVMPEILSEDQKALWEQLAKAYSA